MSLLMQMPKIIEDSKLLYKNRDFNQFHLREVHGIDNDCILARGENLDFMKYLIHNKEMKGKFDLIYIDPPYYSNSDYSINLSFENENKKIKIKSKAYHDKWENGMAEYLKMIAIRLLFIRDLLKDNGCLWIHLDWHSVHYVKVIADEIFGEKNFINEIVWQYKSGGTSKRHFSRKHDTLLFYAKNNRYVFNTQMEKSYNRQLKPYRFKGVKEYKDEIGWHTFVNMKDVWQVDMVGRTSNERTGYATQKPEVLIKRIIETCTNEGDLCGDFFSGSGTLAACASKLNRNWVCCDTGGLAILKTITRMNKSKGSFSYYEKNLNPINYKGKGLFFDLEKTIANDDEVNLKISIKDFKPYEFSNLDFKDDQKAELYNIINDTTLLLIEYWSIDSDYDGSIHKSKEAFSKINSKIPLSYHLRIKKEKKVSIVAMNSFGRRYEKILDL